MRHESLQNGLHKTQHCVNYVVFEERPHNESSSRTDLFRKRSTSLSVGPPLTVCGSVCVLSVLVFKISMLTPSDESFWKSAIDLSTTCCQSTPHACAAAQLRFVSERRKARGKMLPDSAFSFASCLRYILIFDSTKITIYSSIVIDL